MCNGVAVAVTFVLGPDLFLGPGPLDVASPLHYQQPAPYVFSMQIAFVITTPALFTTFTTVSTVPIGAMYRVQIVTERPQLLLALVEYFALCGYRKHRCRRRNDSRPPLPLPVAPDRTFFFEGKRIR